MTIGGSGNTTISASFGSDLKTFTKDGSGLLTVNGSLWVGYVSGAGATLSNGTLNVTNEMIGYLQSGSFTQGSGTTQNVSGSLYLGGIGVSGATGDYWQNGGQNTVGTLYFGGGSPAPGGTYHLAGGTLTAGAINLRGLRHRRRCPLRRNAPGRCRFQFLGSPVSHLRQYDRHAKLLANPFRHAVRLRLAQ